ncbi:MAG TPA: NADPH-dependent assimilatory sulfite reductase hemoprotein subunit [Pirellulales bacterium]|jgi:sulfite reductase (ferredoxin)|nr:NADPH-dependent assimilatory sulfite reductase hemoprotein subunit [Pirellulales bacterium]
MSETKKLTPAEEAKVQSNYLRGTIAQELHDGNDVFGKSNGLLLKFHGTYQQDNRDDRGAPKEAGKKSARQYSFMVRTKIPGGKLTPDQLLAELDLCDQIGNTTLRITTRQGLQLHGVVKKNLHQAIHRINEVQLSTLAACGDVERNLMCCPAPYHQDPVHDQLQQLADSIAKHLCPRTKAYHELWVADPQTGEEHLAGGGSAGHEIEPIYGSTYLPRKFKTAVGLPGDNCVDLYANDLGLMAICDDFKIVGYNVVVGGSFGVTPSAAKTFPAIAKRMAFIAPEQVLDVAAATVRVFRDHGNREDRKTARLKYLIANWGIERFKETVEKYYGAHLDDPHPLDVFGFDDHLGWHEQGDGRWFYGLNIENGRLLDNEQMQLKTALREICRHLRLPVRLTSHQSILFTNIADGDRAALEEILRRHQVPLSHEISNVRRWSMACPALPTCGLAVTESERILPGLIDQLEPELAKLGLANETFTFRMTGCPNGCARPYNSDIGLVGKTMNKYTIFVGGRLLGDRLNVLYKDLVPEEDVIPTLVPLFAYFKHAKEANETFGDFCHRKGVDELRNWADQFAPQPA